MPGFLLAAILWYAPWALACSTPATVAVLDALAAATVAIWLLCRAIERRAPRVPPVALLLVGLLLAQGWWMTANAASRYRPEPPAFEPVPQLWGAVAGTVDRAESARIMIHISCLLGAFCCACDVVRSREWGLRILRNIAVAGSSVILLGVVQRAGVWTPALAHMRPHEGFPFGTFNYHGNAGAFINLVIPAAALLVLRSFRDGSSVRERAVAIFMLCVCVIGAFVNVSRAAMVISLAILGASAVLSYRLLRRARMSELCDARPAGGRGWGRVVTAVLLGATALACITAAVLVIGGTTAWQRWAALPSQLSGPNARVILWRVCWPMAREAGMLGNGPGSFKLLFPQSPHMVPELYANYIVREHVPGTRVSMWNHAHQDYLQTVIEWGWVGASAWAALVVGWVLPPGRRGRWDPGASRNPQLSWRGPRPFAVVALGGVLAHAAVDFPLQVPSIQLYVAMYIALLWARWSPPALPSDTAHATRHSPYRPRASSSSGPPPARDLGLARQSHLILCRSPLTSRLCCSGRRT